MNGAQSLLETFVTAGIDVCFTNPGTSEMHFVAALDKQPGMRAVLGLFEGVVTGAADGYARMAGKPACTLLHLGPGLANGLANLHNARRARSPIVNVVGEHATYHRALDAPLNSDIHGFAGPVSAWIRTSESASTVAGDAAAAVQAALTPPGQIATLVLPADTAWNEASGGADALEIPGLTAADPGAVDGAIAALRSGETCALLLGGTAVTDAALRLASRIGRKTGARVIGDTFLARIGRGAGRVDLPRLPYFAEQAEEALAGVRHLILVDTKAPVSFFAYPGQASELTPKGCEVHTLSRPGEDCIPALEALVEAVGAGAVDPQLSEHAPPRLPSGPLTPETIGQAVGALLPEQAILMNEAVTSGFALPGMTAQAAPHDWLELTGGAIGLGLPAAVGAAVACPDRRVLALQADGSAMYTIQSLWTMARENLDVTVVLFANRKYAILQVEFMRVGAENPGPKAMDMLDLSRPDLDFVHLAKGMGVTAVRATDAKSFNDALADSFATPGPYLIETVL
ncbi:MAG: acetolactate synthase large subunit [Roseibium album]|uniref:acetolactate synthase large subunit n=1 Tax=Roseibium album TaxID=311410 RepID=UPI0032EAB965